MVYLVGLNSQLHPAVYHYIISEWNLQISSKHWNKTKSFIHQGYKNLGKWAEEMIRGAGIFKRLFSLATPMLEDLGQDI